jgi:Transcriptional regulatory protein, C terminal
LAAYDGGSLASRAKGASLARSPSPSNGPQAGAGSNGFNPKIGTTLLILDDTVDRPALVAALKERGLRPVLLPLAGDAREVVSNWHPEAVILRAGRPDWTPLLEFLGQRGIPCVLLGTPGELRSAKRLHPSCLQLLVPAEPDEIAEGAQLVIGEPSSRLPDVIDLGILKIDLRTRTVTVEGELKVLPPNEFEILVQLALQPGAPLESSELLGRVWPGSRSATVDDLHTRIWRLRRVLGDHQRAQPLIVNRRGFGYLLRPRQR